MDVVLQAALIGLLQGLTEFIPISSSAHLEVAPWLFGWRSDLVGSLAFDVFLHLGTLLALLIYFARDWIHYARAWLSELRTLRVGEDPDARVAWYLVVATVPAAVIGFALEGVIEATLHSGSDSTRLAIAIFLVVGAIALWLADRYGRRNRHLDELGTRGAIAIGFSQALALLPGISRSGATISAGLALGLDREAAARFSFLLAMPITLGAGLYGTKELFGAQNSGIEWVAIVTGFVVAAASGMLAIRFLLGWLRSRSVAVFSVYRVLFAVLIVVLVASGR